MNYKYIFLYKTETLLYKNIQEQINMLLNTTKH